ncbi:hypothetical protein NM208_g7507 [Fusarium decemcellulare]|uniref:Uncharacterized protein n=1 Tax=Fusarium decemcellulare TaxID=57161 RepID=A0ACC1S902_9HYPO|nr:hypothetical protein NM208_g7507 [Fusarium decemcellulare]
MFDSDTSPSGPESIEKKDHERTPSQAPSESEELSDGGFRAWLVVVGVWCTSFCSFGWINSIGTFQEYYQNDLLRGQSAGRISWITSLEVFFMMGMGPFVGHFYDRYGPRYLMLAGSILHVFGLMMASISTKYYQLLLAQGVCSAIGVSAVCQCGLNSLHGWFTERRGLAFGIVSSGSSLGGIVLPILTNRMIRQVSFGWAMRTCAFLILFLLIIANLTVTPKFPPHQKKVSRKQLQRPFREVNFLLVVLGVFFFTFGQFTPINYLPVQASSGVVDQTVVEYLVAILNAGSLFGRLASGFLGDKIGRYNIFIIVCYITTVLVLAMWIPVSSTGGIAAFAALFGFFSGAYVSLLPVLIAQISPLNEIGFRTGISFFLCAIGGLVTSPICGAIYDNSGSWVGVKVFAGVFCFAGTTLVLAGRLRITGLTLFKAF